MLKKNKLPLFLLALVVMLSVYYINDTKTNKNNEIQNTSGSIKYHTYAESRLEVMKNRTKDIEGYEAVVASGELSSTEVENTLLKVDAIYKLNYSEVALENEIIALGYDDVFVYVADGKVNIDILTDTFSQTEFVNVALLSKAKFDTNYIVTIHTTALSS